MRYIVEAVDKYNLYYHREVSSKERAYHYMNSMLKVLGNGTHVLITNLTKGEKVAEAFKVNLKGGC